MKKEREEKLQIKRDLRNLVIKCHPGTCLDHDINKQTAKKIMKKKMRTFETLFYDI